MNKPFTFAERLHTLLALKGLNKSELANICGINKSNITRYMNGVYEAKQDVIYTMATKLNINPAWLMGYDVPIEVTAAVAEVEPLTSAERFVTFPILGKVAAGYDKDATIDDSLGSVEIPRAWLHGRPAKDYFILKVAGDSMYPFYQDGDLVLVLHQTTMNRSGQIGVVSYDDNLGTLKKIEYVMGEDWLRLVPLNPQFPPITIKGEDLEHCHVHGIAKMVIREVVQ